MVASQSDQRMPSNMADIASECEIEQTCPCCGEAWGARIASGSNETMFKIMKYNYLVIASSQSDHRVPYNVADIASECEIE
jgi:hypothetical protein